jgi:hypothetical protein
VQLAKEGASDPAALFGWSDVDSVEFGLGPVAVVVQVADERASALGDEKVGVGVTGATVDALDQGGDGIGFGHDQLDQ